MKFLGKVVLLVVAFFASAFITHTDTKASIIERTQNRTYEVKEGYVKVTEEKIIEITDPEWRIPAGSSEFFTIFYPQEEIANFNELVNLTRESISVVDQNGDELDYVLEDTASKNKLLNVELPYDINSFNSINISLTYNSYGLNSKTGAVTDVFVPGFPEDQQFETDTSIDIVNTLVLIPKEFGEVNFYSPETISVMEGENMYEISVALEDLIGTQAWIQVGKIQYFTFEIEQVIPATSELPVGFNTITKPIPRNIQSGPITQEVFYSSITPEPSAIFLDQDNNLMVEFFLPSNTSTTINIEGYATLEHRGENFELTDAGVLSDIPAEFNRYLSAGPFWEVESPAIQEVAIELKGDKTEISEIVQTTFEYVVDRIDYSFVKKYGINNRQGALATLQGGAAVCMEYSDLFIALLRAQGVPARGAFGFGFGTSDLDAREDNTINHQWAEVYSPKDNTWIQVDTTWGEFGNTIIGGDLNHFYSHVASSDPETPKSIEGTFFGELNEFPARKYEINVVDANDISETEADLSQEELLTRYRERTDEERVLYVLENVVQNLNSSLDSILQDSLGIKEENIRQILSIGIVGLPVGLFILLFIKSIVRLFSLRK